MWGAHGERGDIGRGGGTETSYSLPSGIHNKLIVKCVLQHAPSNRPVSLHSTKNHTMKTY